MKRKIFGTLSIVAMLFGSIGFAPLTAVAAQMTAVKDTMSTQVTSATATHTIQWTLPGSDKNTLNDTIAIDFVAADIVPSGTWQTSDFTFTGNAAGSNVAPAAVGTGSAVCSGSSSTNYIVNVDATNATFTITLCTGWTQSASAFASTFVINGTAASGTGLLTNKATDAASSAFTITDTGDDTDSATGALVVEDNSVVAITATVAPTLTFTNDDNAIGFGTLSSAAATYATANAAGSASDSAAANTFAIGTNATSGYTLTYSGANLTSGSNTIPTANGTTTISNDANGTPGTSEWAMSGVLTGSGSMASGYNHASGSGDWKFVPSTTTTLASHTGPTSDSIGMRYLANVASTTPAGAYSTSVTFVATAQY